VKKTRLAPEAEVELREAASWYKERDPEVARRFLGEARTVAGAIARRPLRFPVLLEPAMDPPIRRALFPGFPYAMIFLVVDDVIHVLAVAHQHRAPGYWLYRITQT
jgi:plasmid stabilization system protein ParE